MKTSSISTERIERAILVLRGQKVLLDADLAQLYDVPTKVLLQAVKRNPERFPPDFMFPLKKQEVAILRSQVVTSSWGGRRYFPFAFSEQGAAMLSSVLHSPRAIAVNIEIMRAFICEAEADPRVEHGTRAPARRVGSDDRRALSASIRGDSPVNDAAGPEEAPHRLYHSEIDMPVQTVGESGKIV